MWFRLKYLSSPIFWILGWGCSEQAELLTLIDDLFTFLHRRTQHRKVSLQNNRKWLSANQQRSQKSHVNRCSLRQMRVHYIYKTLDALTHPSINCINKFSLLSLRKENANDHLTISTSSRSGVINLHSLNVAIIIYYLTMEICTLCTTWANRMHFDISLTHYDLHKYHKYGVIFLSISCFLLISISLTSGNPLSSQCHKRLQPILPQDWIHSKSQTS